MAADGGFAETLGFSIVESRDDRLRIRFAVDGADPNHLEIRGADGEPVPFIVSDGEIDQEYVLQLDIASGKHVLTILHDGAELRTDLEINVPAVSADLETVGAGRVIGWVRKADKDAQVWLEIDGRAAMKITPTGFDAGKSAGRTRSQSFSFDLPLPSFAMDGQDHAFALRHDGNRICAPKTWRARYEIHIDLLQGHRFEGWAYDPAAMHLPLKFQAFVNGKEFVPMFTTKRTDVAQHKGALNAGFALNYRDPIESVELRLARDLPAIENASYVRQDTAAFVESLRSMVRSYRNGPGQAPCNKDVMDAVARALTTIRETHGGRAPVTPVSDFVTGSAGQGEVAIVVPVYRGAEEVRACLESVDRTVPAGTQIVLVNDYSPEPRIHEYLREFTLRRCNTRLIENQENLGFPKSVNRGLDLVRGMDVVVLNADTRVPEGWLERLSAWARIQPNIGSVTPMTNNGTIMSYPRMNFENYVDDAMIDEFDALFRKTATEEIVELPTAVGFCMYMTAGAIEDVGFLGEEWGRGYAEEVDWCLKARDRGYIHIAATDTFVGHVGSVSFGQAVREDLSRKNNAVLQKKFPEFSFNVMEHLKNDPLRKVRTAVDLVRLKAIKTPICFHLTNGLGGGTQVYVDKVSEALEESGAYNLIIEPHEVRKPYDVCADADLLVRSEDGQFHMYLSVEELGALFKSRRGRKKVKDLDVLHLHSAINYHLDKAIGIAEAASAAKVQIAATIHDYSWICPRVQMLRSGTDYCGLPSLSACNSCVLQNNFEFDIKQEDVKDGIDGWLNKNEQILKLANVIVAPSEFAREAINSRFPELEIKFVPHFGDWDRAEVKAIPSIENVERYRVGFVGAIGDNKGYNEILRFAEEVYEQDLPIDIIIIGFTRNDEKLRQANPNLQITGRYDADSAVAVLQSLELDVCLNFSIWPETFCYTISETWNAGVPVISVDLGAQGERVAASGSGATITIDQARRDVARNVFELLSKGAEGAIVDGQRSRSDYLQAVFGRFADSETAECN